MSWDDLKQHLPTCPLGPLWPRGPASPWKKIEINVWAARLSGWIS